MTLSKTMQNDVPGASAAMSTAMNQYKVSLDDPMKAAQTMTDYMNIMAAGTVEGSAEIREVAEALKQTGSVAKTFGVEFGSDYGRDQATESCRGQYKNDAKPVPFTD